MKSKVNRRGDKHKSNIYDQCQTPFYALDPLLPFIPSHWLIWESACGEGNIVRKMGIEGYNIFGTDILTGHDFFGFEPQYWDCQITNPPFSTKYDWMKLSCVLKRPFALLMPTDVLAARKGSKLIEEFGIEIIVLNPRINFKMPNKGYGGKGAHFSTSWFTWGLGVGRRLSFEQVAKYADIQMKLGNEIECSPEAIRALGQPAKPIALREPELVELPCDHGLFAWAESGGSDG